MKTVTIKKGVFILLCVVCIFSRCTDKQIEIVPEGVVLSDAEKQQISIAGAKLNSFLSPFSREGLNAEDLRKRLNMKAAIAQYLNTISDNDEKQFTLDVLNHPEIKNLLAWLDPSASPAFRTKDLHSPFDNLSEPMQEATDNIQNHINMVIEEYVAVSQTFNSEVPSNALKSEVQKLDFDIQTNAALQANEKKILLATIETHYQAMDAMVAAAKAIFDISNIDSGGRSKGLNWKKIGAIVGSIVVTAVAVVVAVVVSVGVAVGAIAATAWVAAPLTVGTFSFITGGVAVGGIAGAVGAGVAAIGYNQCAISIYKGYGSCDY